MMFGFVQSIAFDVSWALRFVSEGGVSLLLAIFALKNFWIHVCILNSSDIASYVETSINKTLSLTTTLNIPYV